MILPYGYETDLQKVIMRKAALRATVLPPPDVRREARLNAGLTQQEVADVIWVHKDTFGRWERGDVDPGPVSRKAYVDLLAALDTLGQMHAEG